jgi:hypothetical protein
MKCAPRPRRAPRVRSPVRLIEGDEGTDRWIPRRSGPRHDFVSSPDDIKSLTALTATLVLMATFGCAATRTHEGIGQYVDDSVITTKVKAAVLREPGLKVSEINVETFKGVVQLSGAQTPFAALG